MLYRIECTGTKVPSTCLRDVLGQGLEPFSSLPERVYILAKGEACVILANATVLLAVELTWSTRQSRGRATGYLTHLANRDRRNTDFHGHEPRGPDKDMSSHGWRRGMLHT